MGGATFTGDVRDQALFYTGGFLERAASMRG